MNVSGDNYGIETSTPKINISTGEKESSNFDIEIAEDSTYLFKVRLILEKNLTDLCEKTNYNGNKLMQGMIRQLTQCEVINGKTADLISQVINIANRGVHGEIVSNEYIEFIKRVFPELQKQLYKANAQLHYFTCRRCGYFGYSRIENEVPIVNLLMNDFESYISLSVLKLISSIADYLMIFKSV